MLKKQLYRVKRSDGGITVTPCRPDEPGYKILYRLIADEGKLLTNDGVDFFECRDVEEVEGYYEVDKPEEIESEVTENE